MSLITAEGAARRPGSSPAAVRGRGRGCRSRTTSVISFSNITAVVEREVGLEVRPDDRHHALRAHQIRAPTSSAAGEPDASITRVGADAAGGGGDRLGAPRPDRPPAAPSDCGHARAARRSRRPRSPAARCRPRRARHQTRPARSRARRRRRPGRPPRALHGEKAGRQDVGDEHRVLARDRRRGPATGSGRRAARARARPGRRRAAGRRPSSRTGARLSHCVGRPARQCAQVPSEVMLVLTTRCPGSQGAERVAGVLDDADELVAEDRARARTRACSRGRGAGRRRRSRCA